MPHSELSTLCPGIDDPRASVFCPDHLDVIGDGTILKSEPLGLLCSHHPPGALVLKTFELFQRVKLTEGTVVGGFHSPMERQCLDLLLEGRARVIVVPARGLSTFRIPAAWKKRIDERTLAVVSPFAPHVRRATRELAEQRNRCVAFLCAKLFVPFAAPGSLTERIAMESADAGTPVLTFDLPDNAPLLRRRAGRIECETTNRYLASTDDPFRPR